MGDSIKIKAQVSGDKVKVNAIIKHVMETGLRKDQKTGQTVPAEYIQEVTCEHNGKSVLAADWGVSIAANPYLSFEFTGGKAGDKVKLSWKDNKGNSDSAETEVKAA